jgi:hypothetical protein
MDRFFERAVELQVLERVLGRKRDPLTHELAYLDEVVKVCLF